LRALPALQVKPANADPPILWYGRNRTPKPSLSPLFLMVTHFVRPPEVRLLPVVSATTRLWGRKPLFHRRPAIGYKLAGSLGLAVLPL